MNALALLLDSVVDFSLIAVVALGATAMLRSRSAALRHWVLSSAVACAAAAPLLGLLVPSWEFPLAAVPPAVAERSGNRVAGLAQTRSAAAAVPVDTSADPAHAWTTAQAVAGLWAAGAAVNVVVLLAGMGRLTRVRSRARAVVDGPWVDTAAAISRAYGVRRPVLLLQSDHPTLLVTWGLARPKIVLPRDAHEWTEERIRVVLSHELAHIQRGDWVVQIAAEILRSVHWFNPLAWFVCRQLRHESEHAADDAVLNVGIAGRDYAAHLLDVARAVRRHGSTWSPAPAIVHASTLERRITAMLDTRLDRTPLTRSARVGSVAALFALAVVIASAQAALGTFSGSVLDPMNRTLPNATLVLTNVKSNAEHQVRSDETGRFEFSELPNGDYTLEVKYPGFRVLRGQVRLAGSNVQQNFNMEVGTLEETITVMPGPPEPVSPERERRARGPVPARANDCRPTAHGGNLRPPMKLLDVKPVYPVHLGNAQVGGLVRMDATIAKDGTVKEVRVSQSAHPDLDASAVTAVRQWRFDSTLLNCMPIEVAMKVKVDFKAN